MNQKVNQYILIVVMAAVVFFTGCKENGDLMTGGKLSNLNIINAAVDNLNVYQNGARLNNLSVIGSGSQTGYTPITAGSTNFEVKKAGASDYLIGNFPAKLDTNHYYTLFIAGETADKLFISNDATPADSTSSAAVRFVNASPSSTNVDVTIDKLRFTNIAFKTVTPFRYDTVSTTAGADSALVTVYPHGSTTKLGSGKVPKNVNSAYTIYLQGVPGGAGSSALVLKASVN